MCVCQCVQKYISTHTPRLFVCVSEREKGTADDRIYNIFTFMFSNFIIFLFFLFDTNNKIYSSCHRPKYKKKKINKEKKKRNKKFQALSFSFRFESVMCSIFFIALWLWWCDVKEFQGKQQNIENNKLLYHT